MKGIICLIWFMLIKKKALNYQAVYEQFFALSH